MTTDRAARRPTVLVVDDDRGLVDLVCVALEDAGLATQRAHDGAEGWTRFCEAPPDLVVLDLLMPEVDGLELCKRIRGHGSVPVVLLTSRDEEMDKIVGFEAGADDYVTKPFSSRELVARIRAVLRRAAPEVKQPGERRDVGQLTLDVGRRQVSVAATPVSLTATEFDLLWLLTEDPGRVYERDAVMRRIYGDVVVTERTIDTFVKRIRHKLREADAAFDPIETVRGVGYRYRA